MYFLKKTLGNSFKNVELKCSFNTSFMGKMPFFLNGEVATWKFVNWENVHLPLGKLHIWEVATWLNDFGKVPYMTWYLNQSLNKLVAYLKSA